MRRLSDYPLCVCLSPLIAMVNMFNYRLIVLPLSMRSKGAEGGMKRFEFMAAHFVMVVLL